MANQKILEKSKRLLMRLNKNMKIVLRLFCFDYRGMKDAEIKELRRSLRNVGADYKVYKNTLMLRAFQDLKVDLSSALEGPSALAYSKDQIAPIKTLTDFAKDHPTLTLKIGVVDGGIADQEKLSEYAKIPITRGVTYNACFWYDWISS